MAALAYSIQSPLRSRTNPSSKIQLCRSYGSFAIVPKPAEERGLLWGSGSSFVPKSPNLGFGLHASSMGFRKGFRKCSFSSRVKGGDGDFVRVTKDLISMLVHSLCVKGGDGAFVRVTKNFIFVGSVLAITCFVANMSASHAWRRAVFIGAFIAIFAKAIFESRHRQQVSLPFSLGDTIKVGSLEGQVAEMGLTTTLLLSAGKYHIIVPNSLFSSLEFHNHSRALKRGIVATIRLHPGNLAMIPRICDAIVKTVHSNPMIFLEKPPYCCISSIKGSDLVLLTVKCTLKELSPGAFYLARSDILAQAGDLIRRRGVTLVDFLDHEHSSAMSPESVEVRDAQE